MSHGACVDAWLAGSALGMSTSELVELLAAALDALWARANLTLGDVTLGAIVDRVLYNAREAFPALSSLALGADGKITCDDLRAKAEDISIDELREGVRFVLIELLTVLGNLTADIMTPDLHAELARVTLPREDETR